MKKMKLKKIVLAYSGGLDTSIILKWLIETYDAEVVAFAADVGLGEELDPVEEKGLKFESFEKHTVDRPAAAYVAKTPKFT